MKSLFSILAIVFMVPVIGNTQVNGCYNYLTFKEFQKFYTPSDNTYLKAVYKAIKYPPICRENSLEDTIRVQLINHSKDTMEVVVSGSTYQYFIEETKMKVMEVNSENLINNDTKFITEFYVKYDLDPFDKMENCDHKKDENCNYIYILSYKPTIRH